MATELVHVGFGHYLDVGRVVGLHHPTAAPTKRLAQEAKAQGFALDRTSGRRARAVLVLDTGHVVLVALSPEQLHARAAAHRHGEAAGEASAATPAPCGVGPHHVAWARRTRTSLPLPRLL